MQENALLHHCKGLFETLSGLISFRVDDFILQKLILLLYENHLVTYQHYDTLSIKSHILSKVTMPANE